MRDYIDSHREVSPLRRADDAIELDNTHLTEKQQLDFALVLAKETVKNNLLKNYFSRSRS